MVELQRSTEAFEQAGGKGAVLYALSYDEPEALTAFAEEFGITYTMLSDPDSEMIKRFGVMNTLIPPDDHPWHGIPFPGAYVFDENGVILDKIFEGHLAIRVTGEQLLRGLRDGGADVGLVDDSQVTASYTAEQFELRASVAAAALPPGLLRDLNLRVAAPASYAVSNLSVEFPEHLIPAPVMRSQMEPGASSGVQTSVAELVIPFSHNGGVTEKLEDGSRVVKVTGMARWDAVQLEADQSEQIQLEQDFELALPSGRINVAHYEDVQPGQMDANVHMAKLRSRRGL